MSKEELIKELESLANQNKETNPIIAGCLFTMVGTILSGDENLIGIACYQVNNYMLNK